MPPKQRAESQPVPWPEYLDFQCTEDDAWYGVSVRLEEGEVLRVTYCNFSEEFDERFRADMFFNDKELEEFRSRFRRSSVQLQDWDCQKVVEGMVVTVAHVFGPSDVRFYDAVVDSVNSSIHRPDEGQCLCTFVVLWQHGPLAGERTYTSIENICLLQPKHLRMDPTVEKFLDIARQKLEARKSQVNQTVGHFPENSRQNPQQNPSKVSVPTCSSGPHGFAVDYRLKKLRDFPCNLERDPSKVSVDACSSGPRGTKVDYRSKKRHDSPRNLEDVGTSRQTDDVRDTPGGGMNSNCRSVQDIDLGRELSKKWNAHPKESHYFFRIENLEKDLSPFDVMGFILEKASLASQAFVCPSVLEEFYSRGTILVETEEAAGKLYKFLHDSSYIIMSSRGRPWLADKNWCGCVEGMMPRYEIPSRNKNKGHSSKIKLVHKGTKEYEQAKLLHTLHMEFHDHVHNNLLRRLMEEEKKLMH